MLTYIQVRILSWLLNKNKSYGKIRRCKINSSELTSRDYAWDIEIPKPKTILTMQQIADLAGVDIDTIRDCFRNTLITDLEAERDNTTRHEKFRTAKERNVGCERIVRNVCDKQFKRIDWRRKNVMNHVIQRSSMSSKLKQECLSLQETILAKWENSNRICETRIPLTWRNIWDRNKNRSGSYGKWQLSTVLTSRATFYVATQWLFLYC